MTEALIAVAFLIVGIIVGSVFKPSEDQSRPLEPQPGQGDHGHDHHH